MDQGAGPGDGGWRPRNDRPTSQTWDGAPTNAGPSNAPTATDVDYPDFRRIVGATPAMVGTPVEGQVRGVQTRSEFRRENEYETIWTFRVERYDSAGNRTVLVPVEMRGRTLEGSVSDGDWVRAWGRMRRGTLRVSQLENLTTGASVRARGMPKALVVVAAVLFVLMLAWFAFVACQGISDPGPPPGFPGS